MLIFGINSTRLATENIMVNCLSCSAQNSLQLTIIQEYAHVFWIPFFPTDRKSATECVHCGAVLPRDKFTLAFKPENERVNKQSKAPWWIYSGLMLVGLCIISGFITRRVDAAENADLVVQPQKGDLYDVRLGAGEYTLYKVDRVEGNMVYLFENEYAVDKEKGLEELKGKPFTKTSAPVPLSSLKAMLKSNEILNIERPK